MALEGTDLILVDHEDNGNYCVQVSKIFNYKDYWVLVNEGPNSFKCKIRDLEMKEFRNSDGVYRIMLVQRGEKSYQVTLEEIINKYGNYANPGELISGSSTRQWTVPGGVRSISIVAIGGGGGGGAEFLGGSGGGGGALAYRNNIAVKPGETFTIDAGPGGAAVNSYPDGGVGGNGGDSFVQRNSNDEYLVYAGGGSGGMGSPYDYGGGINPPPSGWRRPDMVGGAGGEGTAIGAQTRRKGGKGGDAPEVDAQGGGGAAAGYRSNGSSGQNTDGSGAPIVNGGPRGGEADDSTNGTAQGGGGVGRLRFWQHRL